MLTRPPSICSSAKGATGYRDTTPRIATTVGSAPPSDKAMEDDGRVEICFMIQCPSANVLGAGASHILQLVAIESPWCSYHYPIMSVLFLYHFPNVSLLVPCYVPIRLLLFPYNILLFLYYLLLNFINPGPYRKEKTKKRYISAGTCHKI